tara:strand:- start:17501 stop:17701 length:201 start_codon:yes stop_codon:yes gene_type:complete
VIDLLKDSFKTMLNTLDTVEKHASTMPHEQQIRSLISFISAMEQAMKEQLDCLNEQAKKFEIQEPN